MSSAEIPAFADHLKSGGPQALLSALQQQLRDERAYHKLFDALCLAKKVELKLPLGKPTSFEDVPVNQRDEFEQAYMAAAREVGQLLLADGQLGAAWVYFHAIRETEPIRQALDLAAVPREASPASEELIDLALFKGLHAAKGVEIMLQTHGTCSTITSLDQTFPRLSTDDRASCAALMVRTLHRDLLQNVQREVTERMPFVPPSKTLRELITGRDWLFAENNYHIDVSHLQATVRFARSLSSGAAELPLARDLAEYGSHLAPQFQYGGEPPFQEFYPAHLQFFKYLQNEDRPAALAYFQQQLDAEPDAPDQTLIAYVMVDLLVRGGEFETAVPLAEKYLLSGDEQFVGAFAELCEQAGRLDRLQSAALERGDAVLYATALLQAQAEAAT
jgi:hypothetical protein